MLYPEHSPIRSCLYRISMENVRSWVAVHFVRHHVGIQPFVSTQRSDRTDATIDRNSLPQGELVNINLVLNAQAWINISRKRLCACASVETQEVWHRALDGLSRIDPELRSVCVKECLYRGFCPEKESCGYAYTSSFINLLLKYRCGGPNGRKEANESGRVQGQTISVQLREPPCEKQGTEEKAIPAKNGQTRRKTRRTTRASKRSTRKNEAHHHPTGKEVRNIEHQKT